MAAPSDPAADAFLCLVDALDAEANAITHAVVRAQATVRSIVDDARSLVDQPDADERTWAEVGVRLMQQRAALVDALAILCRSRGDWSEAPLAPLTVVSSPRPTHLAHARIVAPKLATNQPQPTPWVPQDVAVADDIVVPAPPRARCR